MVITKNQRTYADERRVDKGYARGGTPVFSAISSLGHAWTWLGVPRSKTDLKKHASLVANGTIDSIGGEQRGTDEKSHRYPVVRTFLGSLKK